MLYALLSGMKKVPEMGTAYALFLSHVSANGTSATGLSHFRSCRHGGTGVRAASSSARKTLTLGRRMRLGV